MTDVQPGPAYFPLIDGLALVGCVAASAAAVYLVMIAFRGSRAGLYLAAGIGVTGCLLTIPLVALNAVWWPTLLSVGVLATAGGIAALVHLSRR